MIPLEKRYSIWKLQKILGEKYQQHVFELAKPRWFDFLFSKSCCGTTMVNFDPYFKQSHFKDRSRHAYGCRWCGATEMV